MPIKTCGECNFFNSIEELGEVNEPDKGHCHFMPPVVKVIATPTQDMSGRMNLQINNIQTRPNVSANEKACGQGSIT